MRLTQHIQLEKGNSLIIMHKWICLMHKREIHPLIEVHSLESYFDLLNMVHRDRYSEV